MTPAAPRRSGTCLCFGSLLFGAALALPSPVAAADDASAAEIALRPPRAENAVRFATFNASLYRKSSGELLRELEEGSDQASAVAAILRCIDADVVLLNEFDYDGGAAATVFLEKYLNAGVPEGRRWEHHFSAPVNTGVDSELDLDGDGRTGTPADAWGFGSHPGQ